MLHESDRSTFTTPVPAVALPEDFTILGSRPIDADEYTPKAEYPYIAKGLFHENEVAVVYGAPNIGKSAIVASVCAHISMGASIADRKTKRSAVIYNAAEDATGILDRLYPARRERDQDAAKVLVRREGLDLTDTALCDAYLKDILRGQEAGIFPERVVHVFDTFTLSLGEGDENSSRDVGIAVKNARRIAEATTGVSLIIHHTALDKDRPRGSSALMGNVDTVLHVKEGPATSDNGHTVLISPVKQRSLNKGITVAFSIEDFEVGRDEDGDMRTIPMAVPLGDLAEPEPSSNSSDSGSPAKDLATARAADVRDVLADLAAADPEAWHGTGDVAERAGAPFDAVRGKGGSLNKAVRRALDTRRPRPSKLNATRRDAGASSISRATADPDEIGHAVGCRRASPIRRLRSGGPAPTRRAGVRVDRPSPIRHRAEGRQACRGGSLRAGTACYGFARGRRAAEGSSPFPRSSLGSYLEGE